VGRERDGADLDDGNHASGARDQVGSLPDRHGPMIERRGTPVMTIPVEERPVDRLTGRLALR
jgi:hypothetical protein